MLNTETASDTLIIIPSQRRRLRRMRDGQTPVGALAWVSSRQREMLLQKWREGVLRKFPSEARTLRIAWTLEPLFKKHGYAFASNPRLAVKSNTNPIRNVQRALQALSKAGAVIIVHVGPQRRIFPAVEIAAPAMATVAIADHGHGEPKTTAMVAIHNNKQRLHHLSTTQNAARQDAERRDKRSLHGDPGVIRKVTFFPRTDGASSPGRSTLPPHLIAAICGWQKQAASYCPSIKQPARHRDD